LASAIVFSFTERTLVLFRPLLGWLGAHDRSPSGLVASFLADGEINQ
jgi:hypothetical protein